jgi:hypothetical protein
VDAKPVKAVLQGWPDEEYGRADVYVMEKAEGEDLIDSATDKPCPVEGCDGWLSGTGAEDRRCEYGHVFRLEQFLEWAALTLRPLA